MSTIADVASRAGVSKATASRALSGRGYVSEATRKRVESAARDLSYVAHSSATSLATGRTQTVGIVMPPVDRWFFAELLAGVQESLFALDYDLSLCASGREADVATDGIPPGHDLLRVQARAEPGRRNDRQRGPTKE
ncbi:LacI family DNA-binding transcriptional regulator, partial [Microbacterium sp. BF1]|uniref:LacI family DNA-binding transcriptional regulator n=1 Tax=Microbacterium sp. BF1 TaxID=2821146 RepID=UPI00211A3339